MEGRWGVGFFGVMVFLGVVVGCSCAQRDVDNVTAVYIVTLKQAPSSHFYGEVKVKQGYNIKSNESERMSRFDKPRYDFYCKSCLNSSAYCFGDYGKINFISLISPAADFRILFLLNQMLFVSI